MPESKSLLKVFLCHASQDKPSVRELSQRLFAEGWIDPWLDEKKLLPGQDWRLKIEEAVETSDIVIICLSSNSVSKEGFVQKELRYAREIALEKLEDSIFLIPLRIDECDVPRGLRFYQWADYFGEKKDETYDALLESLKLRHEHNLKIQEKERVRKEKEKLEREATEKVAREKEEHETAVRVAKEKAERESIELVKREKAEREAAEIAAREKVQREFNEKSEREKAERKAAQKVEQEKAISEFFTDSKSTLTKAMPFFRIVGVVGIIIILFWGVSSALPNLLSPIPTTKPIATITPTITLVPPTKTQISTPTNSAPTSVLLPYLSSTNTDYHRLENIDYALEPNATFGFIEASKGINFAIQADVGWNSTSNTIDWANAGCGFIRAGAGGFIKVFLALDGLTYAEGFVYKPSENYFNLGNNRYSDALGSSGKSKIGMVVNGTSFYFFVNDALIFQSNDIPISEVSNSDTIGVVTASPVNYNTTCKFSNIDIWVVKP